MMLICLAIYLEDPASAQRRVWIPKFRSGSPLLSIHEKIQLNASAAGGHDRKDG